MYHVTQWQIFGSMWRHGKPHDDGNRQVQDVNVVMRVDLLDTVEYRPKSIDINFSEQSFW